MKKLLLILALSVVSLSPAGAQDLPAWAWTHWSLLAAQDEQAIVAGFMEDGAVAFFLGPVTEFYQGAELAQGWAELFSRYSVVDVEVASIQVWPESRIVAGTLQVQLADGTSQVWDAFLQFAPQGQLIGADYILPLAGSPQVDGRAQEYTNSAQAAGVTFSWRNGAVVLFGHLRSPGQGYVSVILDPTNGLKAGGNIIIGAVTRQGLAIRDEHGVTRIVHQLDSRQDILRAAGFIEGGHTFVEFAIPLDSSDPQDRPLVPGQTYTIALSYHGSDVAMTARHTAYGATTITLEGVTK